MSFRLITYENELEIFRRFKESAKEVTNKEVLLAPLINEIVISASSFAESISHLLAINFSNSLIPRSTWYSIFLQTFSGQNGKYDNSNIINLMIQDLMVRSILR